MRGNVYKSIKPYCPECIKDLVEEKRKLGKVTKWLVCPKCGMRIAKSVYLDEENSFSSSNLYELNNNGGMRINNQ